MRIFKTYNMDESGAGAVEFALLAPVLILLLVGTVDIGFYVLDRMMVQNTAHAAAEYVTLAQSDDNVQTVAAEAYGRDISNLVVQSRFNCECADGVAQACPLDCGADDVARRFVTVNVSGDFSTLFPYPAVPDPVTLQGFARMRVD